MENESNIFCVSVMCICVCVLLLAGLNICFWIENTFGPIVLKDCPLLCRAMTGFNRAWWNVWFSEWEKQQMCNAAVFSLSLSPRLRRSQSKCCPHFRTTNSIRVYAVYISRFGVSSFLFFRTIWFPLWKFSIFFSRLNASLWPISIPNMSIWWHNHKKWKSITNGHSENA